ncbi:FAD-binding domain-containing protein [Westerdykella ornata]|uniref:FAD-binding domain-containing protein n=1 Tax=Westerdykella ornata TaxID=318751 RepID=A0A6A6J4P0_WESOR|nr:FAD-binding domain-containing protein [Westerdykella ornata]KAF2271244.1 FAD-binding domain-containing protein [Westerdykella ornata]
MFHNSASLIVSLGLASILSTSAKEVGYPPCDALIDAGLGNRLLLATSAAYEGRVKSWWSANARLRPWCFFQPLNTEEVSKGVKALAASGFGAGDWHIAVRSGGHGPAGSNNIANGVTIDLGMMNSSSYDSETKLASVEPGARWADVYRNLLYKHRITVTGGRDGDVGVGGFLLGGGNSYFTGRNGFGCDTVVNFEVVLADGEVVNANSKENSDLWKALKGGALNFGIVTRFDLEPTPVVDLAFGERIVTTDHTDEVIDAIVEFTDASETRRADSMFAAIVHDASTSPAAIILIIKANSEGNLNTTSFDKINNIPTVSQDWRHKSIADIGNENQLEPGTRNVGVTLTFQNDKSILRQCASYYEQLVSILSDKVGANNFTAQMFFQPLPKFLGEIGKSKGGNVMGLDRMISNGILWTAGVSIKSGDDAALELARAELTAMAAELKAIAKKDGKLQDLVYLNYAEGQQDPLGSYGKENVDFLRKVAQRYDPDEWWQRRVPGGFKLSRVGGNL